jgi:hypothetical protein
VPLSCVAAWQTTLAFSAARSSHSEDEGRPSHAPAAKKRGTEYPLGSFHALWADMNSNPAAAAGFEEYVKLAQRAATVIPGSVEADQAFSAMNYIKNKTRNRLQKDHLSVALRLKLQESYSVTNFPYQKALRNWLAVCTRRNYGF